MITLRGRTSQIVPVRIVDSNGLPKTGLVFNTTGLSAVYQRELDAAPTTITLATMTAGTWATGGFIELNSTSMPGVYAVGIPNAAISAADASTWSVIQFVGTVAANLYAQPIRIDLVAVNVQDAAAFGLSRIDATISSRSTYAGGAVASVTGNVGGSVASVTADVGITQAAADKVWASAARTLTAFSFTVNATVTSITAGVIAAASFAAGALDAVWSTAARTITGGTVTNLTNAPTSGDFTAVMKTSLNSSTPTSVTTVTGNVNGNVTGSVGSVLGNVAGSVASVVGNVGGSVASVVATVNASLTQILGTALTETVAGYLAAGFKKWFNVPTPTSTMNQITLVDTTTNLTNAAPDSTMVAEINADVDELITSVASIPTNPLLTNDVRLNHLDVDVSSRSTYAGGAVSSVTGSVGSVASGGITAASFAAGAIDNAAIATDAIGSAEIAATAVTKIQVGLATASALTSAQADIDDIQARLPAALVSGRMNANVGAVVSGVVAGDVLNAVAANYDVALSIGEAINNAGSSGVPPTVPQIVAGVWNALNANYAITGSQSAVLAEALAKILLLGSEPWTVVGPTQVDGEDTILNLTVDDDYYATDGFGIDFPVPAGAPDLTGATAVLMLPPNLTPITATSVDNNFIRFNAPRAITQYLRVVPNSRYVVKITLAGSSHVWRPLIGLVNVTRGETV